MVALSLLDPRHATLSKRFPPRYSPFLFVVACLLGGGCGETEQDRPGQAVHSHGVAFRELPAVFSDEEAEVSTEFRVVNDSDKAVRFERVMSSCGCTIAKLDKTELAPGEGTTLHMAVDMSRFLGRREVSCVFRDDRGVARRYRVAVTGYERVEFEQSESFGVIEPGRAASVQLAVILRGREDEPPPRLSAVDTGFADLVCRFDEGEVTVEPGGVVTRRAELTLDLKPQSVGGPLTSELSAVSLSGGRRFTGSTTICWTVRTPYVVEPRRLFFGALRTADGPVEREVTLERADGKGVVVRSVESSHPAVRAFVKPSGDDRKVIICVVLDSAELEDSVLLAKVTVETNDHGQPVIVIPVAAIP